MSNRWGRSAADEAPVDQALTITMHGSSLVLHPSFDLDADRTKVFVDALNAAVSTGSVIAITRDDGDDGDELEAPAVDFDDTVAGPAAVEAVGAGVVRVRAATGCWTVDVVTARLCRSDEPLEVDLIRPDDWRSYGSVWVTPTSISARLGDGSYLTGRRAA